MASLRFRLHSFPSLVAIVLISSAICCIAPKTFGSDDAVRDRLKAALDSLLAESALSVVIVQRDGQTLLAHANGTYNGAVCHGLLPEREINVTLRHRFDCGSIAKMFTAAAILRLQMAEKLNVQDPVADHVEDIIGLVGDHRSITLHQLLTHTSGISPELSFEGVNLGDRDAMLRYVLAAPLAHKPGEVFEYNNAGYYVLAALVERISGEKFETYVSREVFKPAGMVETGFLQDANVDGWFETPRIRGGQCMGTASYFQWSWGFRGATGVATTAGDLARWHDALRGDDVFDENAKKIFFEPVKAGYACGWFIGRDENGRNIQYHGGGTQGFRSMFTRYPDENIVIVTLGDENCNPMAIDGAMRKSLFDIGEDEGPSIEAVMHLAGREGALNQHGVLVISQNLSLIVLREDKEQNVDGDEAEKGAKALVRTFLEVRENNEVVARVNMKPGVAAQLGRDIKNTLDQKPLDGEKNNSSEVWLATKVYDPNDAGEVTLRGPVEWMVMPRYVGVDDRGQRVVDERTTIVLSDNARRFWPVILRLDRATAEQLSNDIKAATEP